MRILIYLITYLQVILSCGPSGSQHSVRRRNPAKRITPFVKLQRYPNVAELTLGASGPAEKPVLRFTKQFKLLTTYDRNNVVFRRTKKKQLSKRCKDKLAALSIMVENEWKGVKVRVIEGYTQKKIKLHTKNSLHFEGRALDITTDDRDYQKYGRLARLAVDAGFDWVFYASKHYVHVSVKSDRAANTQAQGCFAAGSKVEMANTRGSKLVEDIEIGDLLTSSDGSVTEVIGWLHKDTELLSQFVRVTFSDGKSLTLTPNHLLFTDRGDEVFAGDLRALQPVSGGRTVAAVERDVFRRGVYAPLTHSGRLEVNGVSCSCYAVISSHRAAHAVFLPWRALYAALRWIGTSASDPVPGYAGFVYRLAFDFIPASMLL